VLKEATVELGSHRRDYVSDRAYRLLSAAVADRQVQAPPPESAELFASEEAIRMAYYDHPHKKVVTTGVPWGASRKHNV
jgi:hypothetical protein